MSDATVRMGEEEEEEKKTGNISDEFRLSELEAREWWHQIWNTPKTPRRERKRKKNDKKKEWLWMSIEKLTLRRNRL